MKWRIRFRPDLGVWTVECRQGWWQKWVAVVTPETLNVIGFISEDQAGKYIESVSAGKLPDQLIPESLRSAKPE